MGTTYLLFLRRHAIPVRSVISRVAARSREMRTCSAHTSAFVRVVGAILAATLRFRVGGLLLGVGEECQLVAFHKWWMVSKFPDAPRRCNGKTL